MYKKVLKKSNGLHGSVSYDPSYKSNPCHANHPTLLWGNGEILGASCIYPREGFDVYVGLDSSMQFLDSQLPWKKQPDQPKIQFKFPITDMQAPDDYEEFNQLINYLIEKLNQGKRIHIGCIGGHGRTGTVLSALCSMIFTKAECASPTQYVRDNYCHKAVESQQQVDFLQKHYGVPPVNPTKPAYVASTKNKSFDMFTRSGETVPHIDSNYSIWKLKN